MSNAEVITFGKKEMTPEEEAKYREQVRAAKSGVNALKGSTPIGHVERPQMPDFSALQDARDAEVEARSGVRPRPAGSQPVRPETQQQIQEALEAGKKQEEAAKKAEAAKVEEEEDLFSGFDFERQDESTRILNNKERRKAIESRCTPMNFEDLLTRDEVKQAVPIIPDKFVPTFRSLKPSENLFIKRYMAKDNTVSDSYTLEKYSLCQLTCSVLSINDKMLPDHRDNTGEVDEKAFETKLKVMSNKSGYVIADLALNYYWFDIRVRKLLNPDLLGNG